MPINRPFIALAQLFEGRMFAREKSTEELSVEQKLLAVGGKSVPALLYSPEGIKENAPCLIVYHGGGFVFPAAPYHYTLAREYALRAGCKVLFVKYRLAPKYPFPAGVEDCFAAYQYATENAAEWGIDEKRIAVSGDSAGGCLAAAVCLIAKEQGLKLPCGQMLLYPAVGANLETESMKKYVDTPMCNSRDVQKFSRLYLPKGEVDKKLYPYLSPLEAKEFKDLPRAYIETAEFDCLRDGAILFAEKLKKDGVEVELNDTVGTMHAFDIETESPIVRGCVEKRIAFLKKCFRGK